MTARSQLERARARVEQSLAEHDAHNDGSLRWVDERRELLMELDEIDFQMAEFSEASQF